MTTESKDAEKFLSVKQVSERWGGQVKVRTLNNWRQTGGGPPYVKVGGSILYKLSDIVAWEASRTVSSTSEYKR